MDVNEEILEQYLKVVKNYFYIGMTTKVLETFTWQKKMVPIG